MVLRPDKDQIPDIRRLQLQISQMYENLNGTQGVWATINSQGQTIYSLLNTRFNTPASPVANLLWNGEIGHSAHTWNDASDPASPTTKNEEAAWWYSHQTPAALQTFVAAAVGTNTIDLPNHGLATACAVDFTTTTTLPTGLTAGVVYFVIVIDADTISVATSMSNAFAGTATPITAGTGTGTQTIQTILIATYSTSVPTQQNQELKTIDHTTYYPQFSRWNSTNGWAELTGTTTVDQPLPMNFIDATVGLARVSMIAAKANSFIEIPDEARLTVGLFDNTSGQRQFLQGSIGLAASFNGVPDPGGDERRFRVLLTSDRGYQLLSDEVVVYNTPTVLDATHNITLSWAQQAGQLQVDVYERYDPSGVDEYRLIAQISAATSFIYEGAYLSIVDDYPSATGTVRTATYTTQTLDMSDLAINNVSPAWDTVGAPIEVPNNYNKGVTTDRQWLRIWMSQAANLFVTDVVTDGTTLITIPDGAINSDTFANGGYCTSLPAANAYSSGAGGETTYFGLVVQVYDVDDVLIETTTIAEIQSNTQITLGASIAAGTNRKIRVVGGGFHGILLDKIHLGFQQNTSYAPNALDVRTLQPLAAPASSSQGGVGGGGSGGGIIRCIAEGSPVKVHGGIWKPVETLRVGRFWASGGLHPNVLLKLKPGHEYVRRVRAANGVEILCTDTEKFTVDEMDHEGTRLAELRIGDVVVTEVNGVIERSPIVEISWRLGKMAVYSPTLNGTRQFIAGQIRETRWGRLWARVTGRTRVGGFVLHNKEDNGDPGSI